MVEYPRITIITPVFNQVDYIEHTILSVINQNYPNLEYIIIDGGSPDGTVDVIKKYEKYISKWISESDSGMYEALNKGFKISTGEIMGWINSDDKLLPGSLAILAKLFTDLPTVNWIQGLNSFIDLQGSVIHTQSPKEFSLIKFLKKDFKWIQQESTFWRRNLWEKAGAEMNDNLKLAGDFELWFRYFQYDKLYNTSVPIGAWRKRDGQLSGTFMESYLEEVYDVIDSYKVKSGVSRKLKKVKFLERLILYSSKIKFLNFKFLEERKNQFYGITGIQIYYSHQKNKFFV